MATVDVALRDVPWDQALDIILRANKLGYSVDGTIVRIAPNTVLKLEEDERKALLDALNDASQLGTLQRQLSYAKGEEVAALLKSANVLSRRGQANVDPPHQHADRARRPQPVSRGSPRSSTASIERSRRWRSKRGSSRQIKPIRARWAFSGLWAAASIRRSATRPTWRSRTAATSVAASARRARPAVRRPACRPRFNLPAVGASTSAIGLALGSVNGRVSTLDVALTALETAGNVKLLSTPRVTTQNNVAAEIHPGREDSRSDAGRTTRSRSRTWMPR